MMRNLFLIVFLLASPLLADTWISGEVILEQAYKALEIPQEALDVRYRPAGINVEDGQRTWSTEVVNGPESNTPRVRVRLEIDGDLRQSWIVGFARRRTVLCYVTPKDLIPGRLIDVEQLQLVEKYWDGHGQPITDREDLLGRQSRRYLEAGSILNKRDLILRPVISRGDTVVVNLNQDNLNLSFEGVAKRPGYPGRVLPVTTPAGKTFDVWVDYKGNIRPVEDS